MKIRLKEIPQEGRSYIFDRESGELDDAINDLVGENPYHVDLFIKPLGNVYEMRGHLATAVPEICSNCGYDFQLPLKRAVNEILIEAPEEDRKGQAVHGNHSVDFLGSGPSVAQYRDNVFDSGEYVHETIALEEPFYPMCGGDECLRAEEVERLKAKINAESEIEEKRSPGHPGFSVLQGLELPLSKKPEADA